MLKKRRYLLAAVLILFMVLLAVLLLHAGRGADAEPGASGISFVWAEVKHGSQSTFQ